MPRPPIVICGAGIAGLVSAIVLHRLKIHFVVKALGVEESFWRENTQNLDEVVMTQLEDGKVLQRVDMKAVVSQTPEKFRLVSRKLLMVELMKLIPPESIMYQTKFVSVDKSRTHGPVHAIFTSCSDNLKHSKSLPCRLIIGADGVYSAVRRVTLPDCGITVRYCGEMCYRGVVDFSQASSSNDLKDAFDSILIGIPKSTMLITYGLGIRASVGYLSSGNLVQGYWWVKTVSDRKAKPNISSWPRSLRRLYENTTKSNLYAHEIVDSHSYSKRISSSCSVLIGDAAHPVTPNMGQGACMAIEDAFVLCTNLGLYSDYTDGDVESCYQYEIMRRNHTAAIARSSYIQSKIGQLSNPILVWIRNNIIYNLPKKVFISKLRANIFDINHHLQLFYNQLGTAEG